jgi:hypothetical protein
MGLNHWNRRCHNYLEDPVMSHIVIDIVVVLILIPAIATIGGAYFLYILDKHLKDNNGY